MYEKEISNRATNWVGIIVLLIMVTGLIMMGMSMKKTTFPDVEPEPIELNLNISPRE